MKRKPKNKLNIALSRVENKKRASFALTTKWELLGGGEGGELRGREGKTESEREKLGPRPSTFLSSLSLTLFFPFLFLPPPPTYTIFPSPHLWLIIPVQHFHHRFISCLNINNFEKEPQEKEKKETRSSLSSLSFALTTAAKR